ncbi:MAG: acyl-CoA desaturase [Actinobacteria bacterium]|nr:acyl-CoA desaturase [Actinomycetota bacterium]
MSKLERRITIAAVVIPFIGFVAAIVLLWGEGVTALDLGILALMYFISGMGITTGYHRLLTHRSFETKPWIRAAFAIAGSMSVQGAPIHWVADHRKHHDFSDEPGDPHSPHTHGKPGWRGVIAGWWHSHMGWLFSRDDRASASRYARDLKNDPTITWVDKHFFSWVLLGLAIPFTLGLAIGGSLYAGFTAFLWGGLARIFMQHHATWSVNSICHMYGKQPFEIEDQSRNNWAVAMVALGEGWHHNHHAFPTSAKHGLLRGQLDPSYMMIKSLEAVGLAWNVRTPSDDAMQKKLRTPGSERPFENSPSDSPAFLAPDPSPTTAVGAGAAIAASPLADAAQDDAFDGSQTAERDALGVS